MLVVSDCSPLTALIQIGRLEILSRLFDEVWIPPAVAAELSRGHRTIPAGLKVVSLVQPISSELRRAGLHEGEREAIALALHFSADLLLVDERKARLVAADMGLKISGLLGVLVLAKSRGVLDAVHPVIHLLRTQARCWLDDRLVAEVLRSCGE